MTDDEKYFFDLNGYLILRDVVDPDTIRRCNEAIDHYDDQIEVHERRFEGESKALTSDIRQRWSDEMVAWERPYCEPFRQLMVHPRLKPYLREIIGDYHMATRPRLIVMDQGCAGHYLHGGQLDRLSYSLTYHWKFGKIYNSLTLVEFPLADEGPGDGGLAVVPGGHKANYPIPEALRDCEAFQDEVVEVNVRAGDVVIFAETTIHGTLVWRADHQRRTLLYSYCPRYQTLVPTISEVSYPPYVRDMTPEQQAVLRPPH